jgi:hypothetical protein
MIERAIDACALSADLKVIATGEAAVGEMTNTGKQLPNCASVRAHSNRSFHVGHVIPAGNRMSLMVASDPPGSFDADQSPITPVRPRSVLDVRQSWGVGLDVS